MQNSDNSPRYRTCPGDVFSVAGIDPSLPHAFSPHLRFRQRPDNTFVLETRVAEAWTNKGWQQEGWQEVALWREPEKFPCSECGGTGFVKLPGRELVRCRCGQAPEPRLAVGTQVVTAPCAMGKQEWNAPRVRRYSAQGVVSGISNSHGLCYLVEYPDKASGWFNHEELTPL